MNKKLKYILAVSIIAITGFFAGWQLNGAQAVPEYNKNNLIRFHVVANSDSAQDQALKFKVRDAVYEGMAPQLKDVDNLSKAREIVKNNMDYIKNLALSEVKKHNNDYQVNVSMGNYSFPAKSYKLTSIENEDNYLTLPEGEYEAVRIVIGEGKGANWWCVLYPPLCFVNNGEDNKEKDKAEEVNRQESVKAFEFKTPPPSKQESLDGKNSIKLKYKALEIYNNNFSNKSKI